uniref:Uncharacterized protein n=1 Tax=Acrobeloides nanus TaxID=290746 RepID=A0A914EEA4_9BILA
MADAKDILKRIHRLDKRPFDESLVDFVLNKENQIFLEKQAKKKNYTLLHLFYTPSLMRYTLSLAISIFTTSLIVFGLTFNMESISGGIIAIVEVKCARFGRKSNHFLTLFITATCLFIFFVVQVTGNQAALSMLLRIMTLLILGFMAQIYFLNGVCATELFPTSIRNMAYSFGALFNRLGITCAPQVFFLAEIWKPLPYLSMFLLVVFDMLFFQFNVTETKNNPLSDHMPGKNESWSCLRKNNNLPTTLPTLEASEKDQKLLENEEM